MSSPTSPYYYTPQDVALAWRPLVDKLMTECSGGPALFELCLLVRDGAYAGWRAPQRLVLDGTLPAGDGRSWWNLIRRLQAVASPVAQGMAFCSCFVYVNSVGDPVFWSAPQVQRLEPRRVTTT